MTMERIICDVSCNLTSYKKKNREIGRPESACINSVYWLSKPFYRVVLFWGCVIYCGTRRKSHKFNGMTWMGK